MWNNATNTASPKQLPSKVIKPCQTTITTFEKEKASNQECSIYDEGVYVLDTCHSNDGTSVSCALSNGCLQIYDAERLQLLHSIQKAHEGGITDVRNVSSLMGSCGKDGYVRIFDQRMNSNRSAMEMKLPHKEEALSLDFGCNGSIAAVGGSKASIHFFDIRSGAVLGRYTDAHTQEVTRIRFQSSTSPLLVSGGEDGLLCLLDTSQPSEALALGSVMNVNASIRDVGFFGDNKEALFCITGSETFSIWDCESAQKIHGYGDAEIRNGLGFQAGMDLHYLVKTFWDEKHNHLLLLAGSNDGNAALFQFDATSYQYKLSLMDGHNGCIRSCSFNVDKQHIVTGGEDARLCQWRLDSLPQPTSVVLPRGNTGPMRKTRDKKFHSPY